MSKPARYTVTLPDDMDGEASEFSERSSVSMSDLCRQGLVRLLMELREKGTIEMLPLPRLEKKPVHA